VIPLRRLGDAAGAMHHYRRLLGVGATREELVSLQQRRLVETARHAAAESPIYRELYHGVELADDLDVRALPVVSKDMLMERFDDWVTDPGLRLTEVETHLENLDGDDLYLRRYRCVCTSGTSGLKGVFVYDRDEWRQCLGAFLRWSEMMGTDKISFGRRSRVATVGATSPLHMTTRFGMSVDLGLYALLGLDARTPLPELVAALNEHRPDRLLGYASMISLLAVEQLEGRLRITPDVVATTSEVRTDEMTANIREAWGVEPFNLFGSSESLYAGDCEHHQGMHVFEDLGLVEVVDDRGNPVPDGVVGTKLLITSFIKRTQPLLRYELSDLVSLTSAPCPCGRPHARMVSLDGRSGDILHLKGEGMRSVAVHPITLRSPMASLPEVRQYQIVQDAEGLNVLVVLRDGVAAEEARRRIDVTLTSKLRAAGVADPQVRTMVMNYLPRDAGHGAKFNVIQPMGALGA